MAARKQVVESIRSLHADMRRLSLEAGVEEDVYDDAVRRLSQWRSADLKGLLTWLQWLQANPYAKVKYVLGLVAPETWDNYELLGIKGLTEQKLLAHSRLVLCAAWRQPYRRIDHETTNSEQADPAQPVAGRPLRPQDERTHESHCGDE